MMQISHTRTQTSRTHVRTGDSTAANMPRLSVMQVLVLGFTLFLVVGLFHVWSRVAIVEQGYGLVNERHLQENLMQEQRALTLRLRQLREPARLELAARQMQLRAPGTGQIIILEDAP